MKYVMNFLKTFANFLIFLVAHGFRIQITRFCSSRLQNTQQFLRNHKNLKFVTISLRKLCVIFIFPLAKCSVPGKTTDLGLAKRPEPGKKSGHCYECYW